MAFTILNAIAGQMNDGYEAEEAAAAAREMIRRARSGRFTVQELARRAGIAAVPCPRSNGKSNPSFRTLQKIADALGLRIGDLVEAATSTTRGRWSSADTSGLGCRSATTADLRAADTEPAGSLEMLRHGYPRVSASQPVPPRGEECVLVLEGVSGLRR